MDEDLDFDLPNDRTSVQGDEDDDDLDVGSQQRRRPAAVGEDETDMEALLRHWMDERAAPELLHLQEDLVDRMMGNLEAQTEAASLLAAQAAAKADEHERILLVQLEIERVRFLLRSYIRTRTYKIEQYAQYLLKTPAAKGKMSDVEFGYAQRYQALIERHLTTSVVQNLPERMGRLDEDDMIVKPDLEQAVFARARKNCPPIRLPDGEILEMLDGDIHMLRYRSVRRLLRDGDVRLV